MQRLGQLARRLTTSLAGLAAGAEQQLSCCRLHPAAAVAPPSSPAGSACQLQWQLSFSSSALFQQEFITLSNLRDNPGATHSVKLDVPQWQRLQKTQMPSLAWKCADGPLLLQKKRKGRGIGSGLGKTAGRGHKGQKARSGMLSCSWVGGMGMLCQGLSAARCAALRTHAKPP